MIYLSESIERILERTLEILKKDVERKRTCSSYALSEGKVYYGTDIAQMQLERFQEFKASLEDETNPLLVCDEGKEDEAKIRLMYAIAKFYEPLYQSDIDFITHDVHVQKGLREQIEKLSTQRKTKKEALSLLDFIDNAYSSSWGQMDENYKMRDFRLVETEEEFQKILDNFKEAEELVADKNIIKFTTIRVAFIPIDCITLYKKKGIYEEYKRLLKTPFKGVCFEDVLEMFDLWHDVRETAIYCVYAPEVKKARRVKK